MYEIGEKREGGHLRATGPAYRAWAEGRTRQRGCTHLKVGEQTKTATAVHESDSRASGVRGSAALYFAEKEGWLTAQRERVRVRIV